MNNRELYRLVTEEFGADIPTDKKPRLDKFLISLWQVAAESEKRKPELNDLCEWIKHAYANEGPNFDPQWLQRMVDFAESAYEEWENTILAQINELQEFFEAGDFENLEDEYGHEGWYNFKVGNYLSNAVVGTYGGDTDVDDDLYEIEAFSWQDFADFLEMGKSYN